jgi:hypothetical protein
MENASTGRSRDNARRRRLNHLFAAPDRFNVIHSLSELVPGKDGAGTRRVTAIAILHVGSGNSTSFLLDLPLDTQPGSRASQNDEIEQAVLAGFYQHLREHPAEYWLHWTMRDETSGLPAIARRFEALGGEPVLIPDAYLVDLADVLPAIAGEGDRDAADGAWLDHLMRLNGFDPADLATGSNISAPFDEEDVETRHLYVMRGVRSVYALAEREHAGTMQTEDHPRQRPGPRFLTAVNARLPHAGIWFLLIFLAMMAIAVGLAVFERVR